MAVHALDVAPHRERDFRRVVDAGAESPVVAGTPADVCGDVVVCHGAAVTVQAIVLFTPEPEEPLTLWGAVNLMADKTAVVGYVRVLEPLGRINGSTRCALAARGVSGVLPTVPVMAGGADDGHLIGHP